MKFKPEQFAPVRLKIASSNWIDEFAGKRKWDWVDGWAVNYPGLPRFAVVKFRPGWRATHWDSGYGFGGFHDSMEECALLTIRLMRSTIKSGVYAQRLAAISPVINVPVK